MSISIPSVRPIINLFLFPQVGTAICLIGIRNSLNFTKNVEKFLLSFVLFFCWFSPPVFSQTISYTTIVVDSYTGSHPRNAKLIDFDNDGDQDIFVQAPPDYSHSTLYYYENQGNNKFKKYALITNIVAGLGGIGGYSVADMDHDRDLDIVANWDSSSNFYSTKFYLTVFENVGNLKLIPHFISSPWSDSRDAYQFEVQDMDQDSLPEIVGAWYSSLTSPNRFFILKNKGNFVFQENVPMTTRYPNGFAFRIIDFDKDGDFDILGNFLYDFTSSNDTRSIISLWQNNNGAFTRKDIAVDYYSATFNPNLILDLDRDGDLDIILLKGYSQLDVFENTGTGFTQHALDTVQIKVSRFTDWRTADIDRDGNLDLYGQFYHDSTNRTTQIPWLSNSGNIGLAQTFLPNSVPYYYYETYITDSKDIDADGDLDFVRLYDNSLSTPRVELYLSDFAPEITSPHGGEIFAFDSLVTIEWKGGYTGPVKLEYSTNGGSTWSIIDSLKTNTGSLTWRIPHLVSTQCLLRIKDIGGKGLKNTIDSTFSIRQGILRINSPAANAVVDAVDSCTISWDTWGQVAKIRIRLVSASGNLIRTLTDSIHNVNQYHWLILPTDTCSAAQIVVDAPSSPDIADSSGIFIVRQRPEFTIVSPDSGDTVYVNSNFRITWNTSVKVQYVSLKYSLFGSNIWNVLADSIYNSGAFWLKFPTDLNTGKYVIRISDAENPKYLKTSDAFWVEKRNTSVLNASIPLEFSLRNISKNKSHIVVWLNNPKVQKVTITLYDLRGAVCYRISQQVEAGNRRILFAKSALGIGHRWYLAKVETETDKATIPLMTD